MEFTIKTVSTENIPGRFQALAGADCGKFRK